MHPVFMRKIALQLSPAVLWITPECPHRIPHTVYSTIILALRPSHFGRGCWKYRTHGAPASSPLSEPADDSPAMTHTARIGLIRFGFSPLTGAQCAQARICQCCSTSPAKPGIAWISRLEARGPGIRHSGMSIEGSNPSLRHTLSRETL
jgi:hypothetical protein